MTNPCTTLRRKRRLEGAGGLNVKQPAAVLEGLLADLVLLQLGPSPRVQR